MTSPSVYSIDAGLPFARELAAGVIKLAASPGRLAGALILLPSRRAARALQAQRGQRQVRGRVGAPIRRTTHTHTRKAGVESRAVLSVISVPAI